jgi:GNAT superfamily N-acetyltransferase
MGAEMKFRVRKATEADIPHLYDLVRRLAEYERLLESFEGTEELYRRYGFSDEAIFEALIVENTGVDGPDYLGMALYYYTYSTFMGRPTLWMEDVYVLEDHRGRGIGQCILVELAKIALEKGCGRMEWTVLDWNEPSIEFFRSLGAFSLNEWTTYRLTEPEIARLAGKKA